MATLAEISANAVLNDMTIDGDGAARQQLLPALIKPSKMSRTFDGAPTLTLPFNDPWPRPLLQSGILSKRITIQLDQRSFELAKVRKTDSTIETTFEDIIVAELRRHTTPRKVAAGTVTRVQFARMLLEETPWIPLAISPLAKAEVTKVELARGTVGTGEEESEEEDTWTCLKRIFAEIGWRCYVDAGAVNVGPDSAYIANGPALTLFEDQDALTSNINFDFDIGKPMTTATFSVLSERWSLPPGTPLEVIRLGPADGMWIVSSVDQDLFSANLSVTIKRPEPDLPEPEGPAAPKGYSDASNPEAGDSVVSERGTGAPYRWPVSGTLSRGVGAGHEGLDIAAPTGRSVVAARAGTVSFAGSQSGYGNVVYIQHKNNSETRYAHLSSIKTRRGVQVSAGTVIGAVGSTGNSSGPHLHFELRIGGKVVDPRKYLA